MKAKYHIAKLQEALAIPYELRAPNIGPLTRGAFERLRQLEPEAEFIIGLADEGDLTGLGHLGDVNARRINDRAVALIQHFESCYLKAYQDLVGVWTIGWGHTGLQHKDGTVFKGREITQLKADQLFRYDMEQFEARVGVFVTVPLNDDQFGALVAFDFNTGGLGRSSLLSELNAGDYESAANELLKWTRAGGKVVNGLVRRRYSERRLFRGKENFILETMVQVNLEKRSQLV